MKNKIKILSLMLTFAICFSFALNSAKVSAEKSIKTQIDENQIKDYELEQIVKRGNIKYLVYKHKKSGALAVVHNIYYSSFSGIYFANVGKHNVTSIYALENLFKKAVKEKLKEKGYSKDYGTMFDFENGLCLKIGMPLEDKNIIKILMDELKNPSFLKKNNISKELKKQIKLEFNKQLCSLNEFRNVKTYEFYKNLTDRFVKGKILNRNGSDEIDNLTINNLKKEVEKIFIPQNCMVVLNSAKNKNYKKLLEDFSEEYFNLYEQKKEEQINLKSFVEKKPFREIEVENLKYTDFNVKKIDKKNAKFMARLYFDVSSLSKDYKYFLALNSWNFMNILKNYLKELGYCNVNYNDKEDNFSDCYDSITFDNLIFVDLYGNDKKLFEKETLIKNFKKLIKKFIEKTKNLDDEKAKNLSNLIKIPDFSHYPKDFDKNTISNFLTLSDLNEYIEKSFGLTKNPFSRKYFSIKQNGEIKDILKDENFLEKFKNIKKNFNFFLENDPKYIDIFSTTKKTKTDEEKELNFKYYESPLQFPKIEYKDSNYKKNKIERITKELIYNDFYKKNLVDKGLISDFNNLHLYFPEKNKKEVEDYIFGDFKKEFKNYKPTKKNFKFFKNRAIKEIDYIKEIKENIEYKKNLLKSKERIKKIAEYNKSIANLTLKNLKKGLKNEKKYLKKALKEEQTKEDKERNFFSKKYILKIEKEIKELEQNKENLAFFEKQIENKNKKNLEDDLKNLKKSENFLKLVNEIKMEDIVDLIKKIKFQDGSKLKETKF